MIQESIGKGIRTLLCSSIGRSLKWRASLTLSSPRRLVSTTNVEEESDAPTTSPHEYLIRGVHEPLYLQWLRPQIPHWEKINIRLRGPDWCVLESFQGYIHRMCKDCGLRISETWAAPHVQQEFDILKPESSAVDKKFVLNIHERNITCSNVTSKTAQLLIQIIATAAPSGVTWTLEEDSPEVQKSRYIPDLQLQTLEADLALLNEPDGLHLLELKTKKDKKEFSTSSSSSNRHS